MIIGARLSGLGFLTIPEDAMRHIPAVGCGISLILGLAAGAGAQGDGTCEHPLQIEPRQITLDTRHITLDTRLYANHQDPDSGCAGVSATGPDVVLAFAGAPAAGTVTWTADFPAILYYQMGECDFSTCAGASTSGSLDFDCDYEHADQYGPARWKTPYIVVDGIDGGAGVIQLDVDYGIAIPTLQQDWGLIKRMYR
jgi:hypothetical protein